MIKVLLDGWTLVYEAESPAALHLMTLLATCPADVQYTLALPGSAPDWLPQDVRVSVRPAGNSLWQRLLWEQRVLPAIANQSSADLLHLTTPTPPLSTKLPVVLSPSQHAVHRLDAGLVARLRGAFAAGGMSRLRALFWPADLPLPVEKLQVFTLPPMVHPAFYSIEQTERDLPGGVDLPETYVLLPEWGEDLDLNHLADAWSWVHGSLGEYYPLMLAGLSSWQRKDVMQWLSREGMRDWMQVLPPISPLNAAYLYQRSTVVFHMGGIPAWGNVARNALVCGKPFVATASPEMDAVVGAAAFLVPARDGRALGAALITALVEEELCAQLSQAAQQRASDWDVEKFRAALRQAYIDMLSP